jgi:hypothetical protein
MYITIIYSYTCVIVHLCMMRQYSFLIYSQDFKKAYDSVRGGVLFIFLIEFEVLMKVIRLIIMCLSETYSKV